MISMAFSGVNWTEWQQNLIGKSLQPYETAMGMFFWVLVFTFVIGYVYMKQQSYVAAAIASLIFIAVLGNKLIGMDNWSSMLQIFIALAFTGLFIYFIAKRRTT